MRLELAELGFPASVFPDAMLKRAMWLQRAEIWTRRVVLHGKERSRSPRRMFKREGLIGIALQAAWANVYTMYPS